MKKKIYQLAKEEFEYSPASLLVQEEQIRKAAEEGKSAKGTLFIRNTDNRRMKGVLYTTAPFIHLQETAFSGTEALIDYELCTLDRKAGERLFGEIYLVTSCGECRLEVELEVNEDEETKKAGNLFRLANLARSDWKEAVEQYKKLYAKRSSGGPASQELEELLIDGSKKGKVQISTESKSFYYEPVKETFAESVVLKKDSWGYLKINVWSDADFIQPEHKVIWSDNFIGNEYILEFLIQKEKLHAGKNYGKLYIKTIHQLLTVEVCAVRQSQTEEKKRSGKKKEILLSLTHSYLKYRCGLLDEPAYAKEGMARKKEIQETFSEEEVSFLDIYFMALSGQKALGRELLKDLSPKTPLWEGSVLYLTCLCSEAEEEKEKAVQRLRKLQEEQPESKGILWFLLQVDKEFKKNPEKRLHAVNEYHKNHRVSALFHIEVLEALNEKPALLKHLTTPLVISINKGIRMNVASPAVLERYVFLADKETQMGGKAVKGLKELYSQTASEEVLHAILSIMIQKNCFGSQDFLWYEKGVERQLKIKNLYEAYLCSLPNWKDRVVPKPVLTYFSYDNQLPSSVKEKLYAYIIKNQEKDRDTWLAYSRLMEQFALKRLSEGALNRPLAVLYTEILKPDKLGKEQLKKLSRLIFRQELVCDNPNITGVYIQHKELEEEEYFPLEEGWGDVSIFTENPKLSFVDEGGCRYGSSIEYCTEPYLNLSEWQQPCYLANPGDTRLLLHLYERIEKYQTYEEHANEIRRRVLEIRGLRREYQGECMTVLIHQYFDKMEEEPLQELLLKIPPELVKDKERPKLIDYCILQGLNDRAYELIALWGYEGVPLNRLLRLAGRLLEKTVVREETLLSLCCYLLECGRYSKATLSYLVLYYQGLLSQMYVIWEKAKENGMEAWPLEERILVQLLFTGGRVRNHVRIFDSYYRKKKNRTLIKAYLNYYSYLYFIKDTYLAEEFFQILSQEIRKEDCRIMTLAYLKDKSEKEQLTPEEKVRVDEYLDWFLERDEIFPFFKAFREINRTFVEYRCTPGENVSLFYRFGEMEEFKVIPLYDTGYGIYTASFLLFPDEILQYYIVEKKQEKETVTESRTISGSEESRELEDSAFGLLGAILAARQLKDDAAMEELMKEYILQNYRKEKLFPIL